MFAADVVEARCVDSLDALQNVKWLTIKGSALKQDLQIEEFTSVFEFKAPSDQAFFSTLLKSSLVGNLYEDILYNSNLGLMTVETLPNSQFRFHFNMQEANQSKHSMRLRLHDSERSLLPLKQR